MADIRPFKAYRYALQSPGDLGRFTAPPYDMVDDTLRDALYGRDPLNIVRIDQNRPEPGDKANAERHGRAAVFFRDWVRQGVLVKDKQESLYVYRQEFSVDQGGKKVKKSRTGVIALVRLVDFAENIVVPHEQTLSGPKADRYEHMSALQANTGLIFGLTPDPKGDLYRTITLLAAGNPSGEFTDERGVKHQLFPSADKRTIAAFTGLMKDRTILIADGHHRYETALKYWRDTKNPAAQWVMMALVSMDDPGLTILPFHRLMRKGFGALEGEMVPALRRFWDVEECGITSLDCIYRFLGMPGDDMLFAEPSSGAGWRLTLNEGGMALLRAAAPGDSDLRRRLTVSQINRLFLKGVLGVDPDGHVLHDAIDYVNDVSVAYSRCLDAGKYWGCFFIRPLTIDAVHAVVKGGERMPQKSTNFFPKYWSGLVLRRIED